MDIVKNTIEWNKKNGTAELPFNYKKEMSFVLEELLESTGNYDSFTAREKALAMAEEIAGDATKVNEEGVIDAWADIIVFAIGAMIKLGYDPEKVLDEVCRQINTRTGSVVNGKFVRDPDINPYEADFSICKMSDEK